MIIIIILWPALKIWEAPISFLEREGTDSSYQLIIPQILPDFHGMIEKFQAKRIVSQIIMLKSEILQTLVHMLFTEEQKCFSGKEGEF